MNLLCKCGVVMNSRNRHQYAVIVGKRMEIAFHLLSLLVLSYQKMEQVFGH